MNIPYKFNPNVPTHQLYYIKNYSKNYYNSLKKYLNLNLNKTDNNKDNFKDKIISWLFSLSFNERLNVCCIKNNFITNIIHQLYKYEKKEKIKFLPRYNENYIPFVDKENNKEMSISKLLKNNINYFLNYFILMRENYELINNYNEHIEKNFIENEIKFFHENNNQEIFIDINNKKLNNNFYTNIILSDNILNDKNKFENYFNILSDNKAFKKIINCFQYKNNNKEDFIIGLPEWLKQPENTKIWFTTAEILIAFFEQKIISSYIINNFYDIKNEFKEYENEINIIKENMNKLIFYLNNNKNILNNDFYEEIINNIYYTQIFDDWNNLKKYKIENDSNKLIWKENVTYNNEKENIINYFNKLFNKNVDLYVNELIFININKIFTYDDILFYKIYLSIKIKYEYSLTDNDYLINEIKNINNDNKKKKKKKKKKKNNLNNNNIENNNIKLDKKEVIIDNNINNKEIENKNYNFIKNNKENNIFIKDEMKTFMGNNMYIHIISDENKIINKDESNIIAKYITKIIIDNSLNIINKNYINNKKKKNNFFLYSTNNKKSNNNNNIPFISKLDKDILYYNNKTDLILKYLNPIKFHIIEKIKNDLYNEFSSYYNFTLETYGSFITNLDIECSDIDIYFIDNNNNYKNNVIIDKFFNYLKNLKFENIKEISTASTPIIKILINYENFLENNYLKDYEKFLNSTEYNNYSYNKNELKYLKIDISFPKNNNNNKKKRKNNIINQIEFIKKVLKDNNEIKIIIKIIKRILTLMNLNNPYQGGLSSYPLFLLTVNYIKKYKNIINKYKANICGHIFHDFIKYYSNFDFENNIIDLNDNNNEKKKNNNYNNNNHNNIIINENNINNFFIIIDPITKINAGKSTFRISEIKNIFEEIFHQIENYRNLYDNNNLNNDQNLLEEIINKFK